MSWMMRWAVVTLALGGLAAMVQAQETVGPPKIELSQPGWDFGKVWHLERPVFKLEVRNIGGAELHIKEVRTTCGCTAAQPERDRIPPGESTFVRVEYDTTGKQGDVSSKVIIISDDPTQRTGGHEGETDFLVKGHVKRAITRTPLGGLVIKSLDTKPGQAGAVRLENQMSEPMDLKVLRNTVDCVDVDIKEVTAGMVYDIVARTNRELKHGRYRGQIEFSTGLEKEPRYTVHVSIRLFETVEASPSAIFALTTDTEPLRRRINFHYYGKNPKDFAITGYECKHENVKVNISPARQPPPWMERLDPSPTAVVDVDVRLPSGSELPPEGILIVFSTNDPECPKLDVLATTRKRDFELRMYGESAGQ